MAKEALTGGRCGGCCGPVAWSVVPCDGCLEALWDAVEGPARLARLRRCGRCGAGHDPADHEGRPSEAGRWWHFDYRDRKKYPINNLTFEQIEARLKGR